ncbi:DNA gyrase inhibitor YacG [Hyphomonas sp.]|uniref:DNA gyrase inhibitor YacG n=1 Tax=Hyphomonas sp. TaxID=87 RepID=UPI00391D1118
MSKPVPPEQKRPRCARCRKQPVLAEYRPFCSRRCADADLGHWLTGSYVIAGSKAAEEDGDPGPAAPEDGAEDDADTR